MNLERRGITYENEYDPAAQKLTVVIRKKKGKLTLEEIKSVCREVDENYFLLVVDCFHDEDEIQDYAEDGVGDYAKLYWADALEGKTDGG